MIKLLYPGATVQTDRSYFAGIDAAYRFYPVVSNIAISSIPDPKPIITDTNRTTQWHGCVHRKWDGAVNMHGTFPRFTAVGTLASSDMRYLIESLLFGRTVPTSQSARWLFHDGQLIGMTLPGEIPDSGPTTSRPIEFAVPRCDPRRPVVVTDITYRNTRYSSRRCLKWVTILVRLIFNEISPSLSSPSGFASRSVSLHTQLAIYTSLDLSSPWQSWNMSAASWGETSHHGATALISPNAYRGIAGETSEEAKVREALVDLGNHCSDLIGVEGPYSFDPSPRTSATPVYQNPSVNRVIETSRHLFAQMDSLAAARLWELTPELHAKSFDQVKKFDGNLFVLLSKLSGMGLTSLSSIADFAESELSLSALSSTYLASRYGDRLSISGFADLVKSIDEHLFSLRGQECPWITGKHRIINDTVATGQGPMDGWYSSNIAVEPNDANALMTAVRHLYEWGGYPTLSNVWDAIPLSFVVDWLVNVGDIFESIDRMVYARYYNVIGIINSFKVNMINSFFPGVRLSIYRRTLDSSLHLGVSSVELGLPPILNIIDSAALLAG